MLSEGKKRILKMFFENPIGEYYLREIARNAEIPVNNAHKYLHEFLEKDFLKARKTKKKSFFKANLENSFLLKMFEYFELEKRDRFFQENPELSKLKEITQDILKVVWEPAMVIYDKVMSNILLVAPYERKRVPDTKVIKTISLEEFRGKVNESNEFLDRVFKNRIILYNEFLFWREIGKIQQ